MKLRGQREGRGTPRRYAPPGSQEQPNESDHAASRAHAALACYQQCGAAWNAAVSWASLHESPRYFVSYLNGRSRRSFLKKCIGTFKFRVSLLATAVNTGCDENQTSEERGPDGLFTTAKACPLALATLVDPRRDEKQTAKLRRAPAGTSGRLNAPQIFWLNLASFRTAR